MRAALTPLLRCCSVPYTLECIRNGASLGQKDVCSKDHYTFGRWARLLLLLLLLLLALLRKSLC